MAHNELEVFKRLVSMVDYELNDLYIHIDNKYNKQDFRDITNKFVNKSKVIFVPSINVYWGGVTQVMTELNILQAAVDSGETYSFYHYLSGVDLPLTTNETRYAFFEKNAEKEFIEIQSNPMKQKWEKRAKYYWFFEKKSKKPLYKFLRKSLVLIQIIIGVNRLKHTPYKLQYGSNWVSITNKLANDILSYRNELEKLFDKTHCSDELLFQTFVNTMDKYSLYCDADGKPSNARYIDWENASGSGSPSILSGEDIQYALDSNAMFARKFSGKDLQTLNIVEGSVKIDEQNS